MDEKANGKFELNVELGFNTVEFGPAYMGICNQIPMLVVGTDEEEVKRRAEQLTSSSSEVLQSQYEVSDRFHYLMERGVPFKLEIVPGQK